ncbi:uncharacterized protein MAM_04168 [Metarhizium album ARSEF 1941]|uniref:Involucrin repeat protein n=1 Tax=Metarhizium album (strain ARSEF 1941) TaxID=1081103 RepID=A0A0B2WW15_METAS|nr:uncharacterized protein MAM_04168 [Metarhizium album ARSEF 1941]KHN97779.1 hypothetical protein MAM_04168 [Metarhizium album ARSEF 1941]
MDVPEKRRGGGHALRTGSRRSNHSTSSTSGTTAAVNTDSTSGSGSGSNSNSNSSSMPVMPPRAAILSNHNNNSSSNAALPEDCHENTSGGGVFVADKDKDGSCGPAGSASVRYTASSSKEKQKERGAALMREKDERIAHLQGEMDIMEREFQRELDRLSQNESETATFWQAKHSALNQQYLRTDTELRLLRAEVDVQDAERDELRQGWEVLRRELQERNDEVRGLRSQIRGLKQFVSTSTRTDGQTSDEVFGDGMARLGNGLQNWVITHFRRTKLVDFAKVDEATLAELGELVPMYEALAQMAKVHLLQSVVSKILVQMVFNTYFVGLSDDQTRCFRQMEELLSCFSATDESINQWRASTLALVRRDAPRLLQSCTAEYVESVISRINRILDSITDSSTSSVPPSRSEARDSALRVLVNNSVELARLLAAQKAVLRVYMPEVLPHQEVMFEPDTMEDLGDEDEEALVRRDVWCVVFPGVIKHGDENGGQLQFRNVIAKARVLCSPEC